MKNEKFLKNLSLYSDDSIYISKNIDVYDFLKNYEYSKTIDEFLKNEKYNEKFFENYLDIEFIENENFFEYVNLFLELGYNANEVNKIFELSTLNQKKLTELEYTNFLDYMYISNYNVLNTLRYDEFFKNNTYDINTVVTYVNINIDLDFYSVTSVSLNPSDTFVLVNKYNALPSDYVPNNLVSLLEYPNFVLREDAANAANLLMNAAKEDNIFLEPFSAYRSYDYQKNLFTKYSEIDGLEAAFTYSAMAGHSEHQTGLAIDVFNYDYYYKTGIRVSDDDYAWILKNAPNYGFIVRYIKDSSDITGYIEEPWHLRYLGVELAKKVSESNITYDEYYDLYLTDY